MMDSDSAPPILTDITSTYLECALHSTRYHCLLRLRSNRIAGGGHGSNAASAAVAASRRKATNSYVAMAVPDISSLSVIPIHAARQLNQDGTGKAMTSKSSGMQSVGQTKAEGNEIHLLPNLFRTTHHATATDDKDNSDDNDNNVNDDNESIDVVKNHPCHELVRITRDLEAQLKERLKDASDGTMHGGDGDSDENFDPTPSEMQEEFLLRSEALLQELLSAVQQQIRKEQATRGGSKPNKKRKAPESTSSTAPPPLTYYSALVRQLHTLQCMPNVIDISLQKQATSNNNQNTPADLARVSVTCLDGSKRSHTWHAELYPSIVLTMDLPSEFELDDKHIRLEKWWEDKADAANLEGGPISNSTALAVLPRIHHHFEEALAKYQPLFNELDDLDSHLWILEPSLPARRCSVERRIALWEGGASASLVLDPDNPRGTPVMVRFLGVTMATMKAAANAAGAGQEVGEDGGASDFVDWRTSFAEFVSENDDTKTGAFIKSTKRWSEERSVRENLELWFGSPLPSPLAPSTEKSDFLVECGICYAHRLPMEDGEEGPLPEAKCNNPSCNRHYHESCLFEWLHSLPTAKVSFDRIFGSCPYCCEAVSVKIMNGANN